MCAPGQVLGAHGVICGRFWENVGSLRAECDAAPYNMDKRKTLLWMKTLHGEVSNCHSSWSSGRSPDDILARHNYKFQRLSKESRSEESD